MERVRQRFLSGAHPPAHARRGEGGEEEGEEGEGEGGGRGRYGGHSFLTSKTTKLIKYELKILASI